jgi:hypothetical protein
MDVDVVIGALVMMLKYLNMHRDRIHACDFDSNQTRSSYFLFFNNKHWRVFSGKMLEISH